MQKGADAAYTPPREVSRWWPAEPALTAFHCGSTAGTLQSPDCSSDLDLYNFLPVGWRSETFRGERNRFSFLVTPGLDVWNIISWLGETWQGLEGGPDNGQIGYFPFGDMLRTSSFIRWLGLCLCVDFHPCLRVYARKIFQRYQSCCSFGSQTCLKGDELPAVVQLATIRICVCFNIAPY